MEEVNGMLQEDGFAGLTYYDSENWDKYEALSYPDERQSSCYAMRSLLNAFPFSGENPIELALADITYDVLGIVDALNEVGYNLENSEKSIPVFGVDINTEVLDAMKKGMLTGTITGDMKSLGEYVLHLVENIQRGKELMDGTEDWNTDEKLIRIPFIPVTAENVEEVMSWQ